MPSTPSEAEAAPRAEDDWDEAYENLPRFFPLPARECELNSDGRQKVVGESYYQEALKLVTNGQEFPGDFDSHLPVKVVLRPEPENPWDAYAVRVDVALPDKTVKVGYLPAHRAEEYQPVLFSLYKDGVVGTCPGRVCGGGPERNYGIYLHLAHPEELLGNGHFTSETETSATLAASRSCVVTGAQEHQVALEPFAARADSVEPVGAVLEFCSILKGKYAGERAIEVRLSGQRVGQLTRAMSKRYEALLDEVHESGRVALCSAWIFRTDKGLGVRLGVPVDPTRRRKFLD